MNPRLITPELAKPVHLIRWRTRCVAAVAWIMISGVVHAACEAPANANACPLQGPGGLVFDRCFGASPIPGTQGYGKPTLIGNQICNSVRDTNKLLGQLGNNANSARRDAERDWNAFVTVATKGAIDADAVRDLQQALQVPQEIEREVKAFIQDRECGTPAAMDTLNRNLAKAAGFLTQAGQVAGLSLEAVGHLRPVADEVVKIVAEMKGLATAATTKGGKAKVEFDALQKAMNALSGELQSLLTTDFNGVVTAGGALIREVGPFIVECAGCATALSATIGTLTTSGTVAIGGATACPASAGLSCILPAVGLPIAAAAATIGGALASGPCAAVAAGVGRMEEHVLQISNFVNGMVKLANAVPKSVTQAVIAGQAFTRLAAEMGREGKQSIDAIQASLNRMQPAFDAAGDLLEKQIAPKVARMAGDFVGTLGQDAKSLGRCYAKLNVLVAGLGADVYEGLALLVEGSIHAVDAGKVVGNLQAQGTDALSAASSFANTEWNKLKDDHRVINRRLWGVEPGVVDLGKTIPHLVTLASRPDEVADILGDSARLLEREVGIALAAVDAGKRAFLEQSPLTAQARTKYGTAKTKAREAMKQFAIAREASEARKQVAKAQAIAAAKAQAIAAAKARQTAGGAPVAQTQALAAWPSAPRQKLPLIRGL